MKDETINDERPTESHFIHDTDPQGRASSYAIYRRIDRLYCTGSLTPGCAERHYKAVIVELDSAMRVPQTPYATLGSPARAIAISSSGYS